MADEMGLGKTVQSVALVAVLQAQYGVTGPSLVVVPLSTIEAWRREFQRWAPSLRVLCYVGDAGSRATLRHYELPHGFHVLLTTYELVMRDAGILLKNPFSLLLVDEGHRLKSGGGLLHSVLEGVAPDARVLVTGTPLQNNLQELWALLHFLRLPDATRFPDYSAFCREYGLEGEEGVQEADLGRLHALLRPHMLRRLKADVEKALPGRHERVIHVPLSREQRELYRLVLGRNYRELAARQSRGGVGSLSNILMELRKVCNHPALLLQDGNAAPERSGKLQLLDGLLPALLNAGHRVLLFSQMVRMLDVMATWLAERGLAFLRLDGGTSSDERRRAIDAFNDPASAVHCFLLSTRAGGLGINLETADTVIIFDSDWNPQNDLQAMARAHRIGQTRPVTVLRLVAQSSVEERILERARQKMLLDRLVIQRTGSSAALDREELQAILQHGAQAIFAEDGQETENAGKAVLQSLLADLDALYRPVEQEDVNPTEPASILDQFRFQAWEQIIPADLQESARREAEEQERLARELEVQQALLISSSSRRRRKPIKDEDDHEGDGGEDKADDNHDDPADLKEPVRKRKAPVPAEEVTATSVIPTEAELPLSKTEARAVLAALLQFGLVQPARLHAACPDINPAKIDSACETLARVAEATQCKAVVFPNGLFLPVAQLRGRLACLSALKSCLGPTADHNSSLPAWRISDPGRRCKSVMLSGKNRWAVPSWSILDDSRLLAGVWRHGFGNWMDVIEDPELQLMKLKEPFGSADAKALPKALHLGRRVEYLLNALDEEKTENSKERPSREKTIKEKRKPRAESTDSMSAKVKELALEKPAEKPNDLSTVDLRHVFKPARQHLAFLASLSPSDVSARLDDIRIAVSALGSTIKNSKVGVSEEGMWAFVAKAWPTDIQPAELMALYEKIQQSK